MAPQDSDTDSGICADYDQPSPKQRVEIPPIISTINTTDYLSREPYRRPITSFEASLRRQSIASKSAVVRRTKAYRVRFADEVDSASSIGSNCFDESNKSLRNLAVDRWQQQFSEDCLLNYGCLNEGVVSPPKPRSYQLSIYRAREKKKCCESIRDFVIRQNVYEASKWTLHNRSSSLPRLEKYEIPEFTPTRSVNYQVDHLHRFSGDNGEKLNSDNFSNTNNNTARRLRLPVVPLPGSSKLNEPHQDVHSSNHLCSTQQNFRSTHSVLSTLLWSDVPESLYVSNNLLQDLRVPAESVKCYSTGQEERLHPFVLHWSRSINVDFGPFS